MNWIQICWIELIEFKNKFNSKSTIGLRLNQFEFTLNWKEIGCKSVEKVLKNLLLNMVLEKINQEDTTPCLFTWEWAI